MSPLNSMTISTSSSGVATAATTTTTLLTNGSGGVDVGMALLVVLALLVGVAAVVFVMWGLCRRLRSPRSRSVEDPSPVRQHLPWQLGAQLGTQLAAPKAGNPLVFSLTKPTAVQPPIYKPSSGYEKLLDPNRPV